jgi:tRNA(fMet)-specific endonuclease VapC
MIRYLLDTNIVSYFIKGISDGLIARMELGFNAQNIAISAVTCAELRFGMEMMDAKDRRRARITLLLDDLPALHWTTDAAVLFGEIKAKLQRDDTPIGDFDIQIGAHALAEDLILVTHNTRHFERIAGLKLEDWVV